MVDIELSDDISGLWGSEPEDALTPAPMARAVDDPEPPAPVATAEEHINQRVEQAVEVHTTRLAAMLQEMKADLASLREEVAELRASMEAQATNGSSVASTGP
jgi:hypothetical protein